MVGIGRLRSPLLKPSRGCRHWEINALYDHKTVLDSGLLKEPSEGLKWTICDHVFLPLISLNY